MIIGTVNGWRSHNVNETSILQEAREVVRDTVYACKGDICSVHPAVKVKITIIVEDVKKGAKQ